jgi:polyribonucleotide nucleotidyltransferase
VPKGYRKKQFKPRHGNSISRVSLPNQDGSPQSTPSQTTNPQSTSTPTEQKQQSGQIENVLNGVANLINSAINLGLSNMEQQKKIYLQQIQQQIQQRLKAQMAAQKNINPSQKHQWEDSDCTQADEPRVKKPKT